MPVIEDGRTGLLVGYGDVAGLARKLVLAARNETMRHDIGQNARAFVERHHRFADYAPRFEHLLRDAAGAPAAGFVSNRSAAMTR